jgi:hypothetical protein
MRNNFYPSKPQMVREIEKCIAGGNLETLLSFCKSCVFTLLTKSNEPACGTCVIRQGICQAKENRGIHMRKNEEILSDIIDALSSDAHC